ncbi:MULTISPECIES: hypothetical protein [Streptomyces]|uniref:hypothetical protein n=1 Tax=Streptomyces TaxID=1883 RepID=UPI0029A85534|nr:hypothetical protein [Streptomyces scabiei]MDX3113616.1 hypothetical protein [Streptomyces scabiei]
MGDQHRSQAHDRMRERLAELKRDRESGQRQLQRLMQEEATTHDGLLRVSGAIQVLEELLGDGALADGRSGRPDATTDTAPSATPEEAGKRSMSVS